MTPLSRPRFFAAACPALLLAACATTGGPDISRVGISASPWAEQSRATSAPVATPWSHQLFPGKAPTTFEYARIDGRDTIAVDARSSASMLRKNTRVEARDLGTLRFSWKVPDLIAQADLALRDKDDAAVRLVLVFEGDRARFSARDAALSELARAVTGEELPYATLMYVWCDKRPPGTVIRSPRTDRIRKLVVETGRGGLNRWRDYERDVRADYQRVFGEPAGALVGVALMTDSDNTRSKTRAWYGPVSLAPPATAVR